MGSRKLPNYRRSYVVKNRGFGNGRYYICGYCGKIVPVYKMQVDHIFPKSKLIGHIAVDYTPNLLSSCEKCNKRKSNKTGLWIARGVLGKILTTYLYELPRNKFVKYGTLAFVLYLILIN